MRNYSFLMVIFLATACAGPATDDSAQRATEKDKPFSENMKQDGRELSAQIKADAAVLQDQVEKDSEQVQKNVGSKVNRMANNVRDRVKITGRKLREWWLTPLPEQIPTPVASSYCYHVLQDIVCYRQPLPGGEHRIAGYQGTHAAAPPVAMTEPLPQRVIVETNTAENRVAVAKPVFSDLPPEASKEEKSEEAATELDATHETLPDPALAPQL